MKTSYEAEAKLASIRCDRATLGGFFSSIIEEFGGEPVRVMITVAAPGQETTFESVDEFVEATDMSARARLSCHISDGYGSNLDRRFHFATGYGQPSVSATGQSRAWCAGVVDVAGAFAMRHHTWYWRLRWWMPFVLLVVVAQVPWITRAAFNSDVTSGLRGTTAWLALVLLLMILAFRFERLFPRFTLVEPGHQVWYRRYATEITIAAAAVSALAAVLSVLLS